MPVSEIATSESLRPFHLHDQSAHGRVVRLQRVIQDILTPHQYPPLVNYWLAEMITLTALLRGSFKLSGVMTLQLRSEGPLRLLVCDMTQNGDLRAYARFDETKIRDIQERNIPFAETLSLLTPKSSLLFVMDPDDFSERYQGIVATQGATLAENLEYYFKQSVQCDVSIVTMVQPPLSPQKDWSPSSSQEDDQPWACGGLFLQRLPSPEPLFSQTEDKDPWTTAEILSKTLQPKEFLDPTLSLDDILFRLFHEVGVSVFDSLPVQAQCRCSLEKVQHVLLQIEGLGEEDKEVVCDFCKTCYAISVGSLL